MVQTTQNYLGFSARSAGGSAAVGMRRSSGGGSFDSHARVGYRRASVERELPVLEPDTEIRALRERFRASRVIDFGDIRFAFREVAATLATNDGQLAGEETTALSDWLKTLARGGDDALAALRDFFSSGLDAPLTKQSGAPSSLRVAALEALRGIDSLDALGIALDVLANTRQPLEVAAVAKLLEERAPGQYSQWVASAARDLVERGAGSGSDAAGLGPLMKILGEAGGVTPAELEQLPSHQREYAAVTLTLLPEGKGLPLLLDRVQGPGAGIGNQDGRLALQLLAQTAAYQPEAAAELVAIARDGLIPDALWPDIAALAAGAERIQLDEPREGATVGRHYYYKAGGTQLLYRARTGGPASAAEAQARLEVIGRLFEAGSGAAARQALAPFAARLETETAIRQDTGG